MLFVTVFEIGDTWVKPLYKYNMARLVGNKSDYILGFQKYIGRSDFVVFVEWVLDRIGRDLAYVIFDAIYVNVFDDFFV